MKSKTEFLRLPYKFEVIRMHPDNTNSVLVTFNADTGSPSASAEALDGPGVAGTARVSSPCIIFDAWGASGDWEHVLDERGLRPIAIYATHGHFDHLSATPALATKYNIPWYLNHCDAGAILMFNPVLKYFGLPEIPDDYKRSENLPAGEFEFLPGLWGRVILTPGHSAGGAVIYFAKQNILIIGDTLFQETVGRYDLPGGDENALFKSIGEIYDMNLPDDTVVIHGHGLDTTIGWLKSHNPYFKKS